MKTTSYKIGYTVDHDTLKIRIAWRRKSIRRGLGIQVNKTYFDGRRCVNGSRHGEFRADVINLALDELELKIKRLFLNYSLKGLCPTAEEVGKLISGDPAKDSIWGAYDAYIREEQAAREWSDNTLKSVITVRNILKRFRPRLTFEDINEQFIQDFVTWQQKQTFSHRETASLKGYANSTILKHCAVLGWFLKWCVSKKLLDISVDDITKPRIKTIPKPVIYLTREELETLEKAPFPADSIQDRVRDLIVFCSYTGLRFSDAMELTWTAVKSKAIYLVAKKTRKPLVIDLNSHSRAILDKLRETNPGQKVFRSITLNEVNYWIKCIGEQLCFDEPIPYSRMVAGRRLDEIAPKYELLSSHVGRRTFVVLALSMGIPPQIVMKWTGHSAYSAMKPYIDIIDSTRSDQMKKFDL